MSAVRTFFRHCPSCGRRFEIRLVKKEKVDSESLSETAEHPSVPLGTIRAVPLVVHSDSPVIVDVEDFRYSYKCRHCGHEWSEVRKAEKEFDAPKGYTGD
jgi:predicted RNA-binding Zn-ribbon protein involved in translation (DUF1610 family)